MAIAGVAFVLLTMIGFGMGTSCTTEYGGSVEDGPCAHIDRAYTVGVVVEVVLAILAVVGLVVGGRRYPRRATLGMPAGSIACVTVVALVSALWPRP